MISQAEDDEADPPTIADNFTVKARTLSGLSNSDSYSHVDDTVKPVLDEIDARRADHKMAGISSGWKDLDEIVGGWRKGELIILGARPSMGKSAFALHLSMNAALSNKNVLFVSIEMSETMTTQRLLALKSGIDLKQIQNNVLSIEQRHRLRCVRADLLDSGLYLAASNPMSMQNLRSKAVRLASTVGCDLVVVDYLQMIATTGQNRTQEVGQISRGLKALARELDTPVIALSSLNRSSEKRDDKRPMMSDIRESGDIESDADVVMFLYRPSYYMATGDRSDIETDECEVIIGKNRNGPVGTAILEYAPRIGRFSTYIQGLL
jgi:replicative DNA helicase